MIPSWRSPAWLKLVTTSKKKKIKCGPDICNKPRSHLEVKKRGDGLRPNDQKKKGNKGL